MTVVTDVTADYACVRSTSSSPPTTICTSAISLNFSSMDALRSGGYCVRETGVPGRERWGLRGLAPDTAHGSVRTQRERERQSDVNSIYSTASVNDGVVAALQSMAGH